MFRPARLRSAIAIGATSILVSLSYEVRSKLQELNEPLFQALNGPLGWLVWSLALILSLVLAAGGTMLLWNMAVRLRCLRRLILGRTWIEGTWFFHTSEYIEGKPEFSQVGIAQFSYGLPDLELLGHFSSVVLASGEANPTEVISMMVDDKLHYMHRFVRYTKNVQAVGAAYGVFLCDIESKSPNRYVGGVIYLEADESHKRRQTGVKLTDSEVRARSKRFGSVWRQQALRDTRWLQEFCTKNVPISISETIPMNGNVDPGGKANPSWIARVLDRLYKPRISPTPGSPGQ